MDSPLNIILLHSNNNSSAISIEKVHMPVSVNESFSLVVGGLVYHGLFLIPVLDNLYTTLHWPSSVTYHGGHSWHHKVCVVLMPKCFYSRCFL